jgi:hypothetical protein
VTDEEGDEVIVVLCQQTGFRVFGGKPRSPRWSTVRAKHLKGNPRCGACGARTGVEVHHVEPDNLITLCDETENRCHFTFGHLWDWRKWNDTVRQDAMSFFRKAALTAAFVLDAKSRLFVPTYPGTGQ